jgi:hypothetical protein
MCAGNSPVVRVEDPTLAAASLELTTTRGQLHKSPHMRDMLGIHARASSRCNQQDARDKHHDEKHRWDKP